jgi:hypothetical protein
MHIRWSGFKFNIRIFVLISYVQNRPLQTDSLFALFKPDAARQPRDGDDEKEKEAAKVRSFR